MKTLWNRHSSYRHRHGVTLWEVLVAMAISQVVLLGFFFIVEKALSSAVRHRDIARALIWTQNELEWRYALFSTTGRMPTTGTFSFTNPTTADLQPPYSSQVVIGLVEGNVPYLRAEVSKEHPQQPLKVALETMLAKEEN
ncbi:MAG: hypothetical protein N2Z21_10535 [Candidatus Sumerlaeaceae bacterium]|nr:hypothetical protein [Candidatus Sumerlaeaceae bacterium]